MEPRLLIAFAIVLAARLLSGLTGFGFGLVVVPPLLLFYEPSLVVPTIVLLAGATGWILLLGVTRHIRVDIVRGLLPGSAVGSILGVLLLSRLPDDAIRALASGAVLLFALAHASGRVPQRTPGRFATAAAGFASGALNTSVAMAGPPVVMLLAARRTPMAEFRATTIAYFFGVSLVGTASAIAGGIVDGDVLRFSLALLPATILGLLLSRWVVRWVSPTWFGRLTLALLLATGVVGLIQAAVALSD